MSGFNDYARQAMEGFQEGAGVVGRDAWADIGDSYQEFLTADATVGPPDAMTGDMVHTGPEAEPLPQSFDAALHQHQAMVEAEQQAANTPEITAPDISAPDIDAA